MRGEYKKKIKEYRGRREKKTFIAVRKHTHTHAQSARKKKGGDQSIDHSRENNNRNTGRHSLDQQLSNIQHKSAAFNIQRRKQNNNNGSTREERDGQFISSRGQNRVLLLHYYIYYILSLYTLLYFIRTDNMNLGWPNYCYCIRWMTTNASEQSRINLDDDDSRVAPAVAAGPSSPTSVSSKVVATWSTELSMSLSDWVRPLIGFHAEWLVFFLLVF